MKILSRWKNVIQSVLWCATLLFSSTASHAEDEEDTLPRAKDTVIVPYDPKKPVRGQKPDKLYVPYERFLELWEAAKEARAAAKPEDAPRAFAISSARYEARIEAERVAVSLTMDLTTYNEEWVSVPLPFNVRLATLTLDGKPVSLSDGNLLVPTPGRHALAGQFEVLLAPGQRQFAWTVPPAVATRLVLTLPDTRWTAAVQPGAGVIEQVIDGKKTISAALGDASRIEVTLVEAESAGHAAATEPAAAELKTMILAHGAFERIVTAVDFSHPGASRETYSVRFPRGLALVDIEAPGLRAWKLADAADGQTLELTLAEPVKDAASITLVTERGIALPSQQTAPVFTAGARRNERVTLLASQQGVDLKPAAGAGLRQLERTEIKNPLGWKEVGDSAVAGVWAGDGALTYQVSIAPLKHEATVHYVYQVNRRKIELVAAMQLQAKGGPLFDAAVSLPAGFEVMSVDSPRLQSWWLEGGKLRVRFLGATPVTTPLVLHLVRLYPTAPQQLDVQPLVLDGFAKVTGDAVIAAHKGVDALLKLKDGGEAKELDAANAATDFQILPPLERKRGFTFKGQAFAGQVALTSLPARWNASWVLHAQAHEAWASLSLKAQLTLRQGSVDSTTFSLPAKFPEARVGGSEVRESRAKVVGDRRVYEVHFHDDVYETVDFTVDVEAPMTGELLLPSPDFPGAQIVTGFVVADNASEYEMKLKTEGVEPVRVEEMPWQPVVTKSAGVFRVQSSWKVGMTAEKLEKTESRSAYCAWAEMTTSLRRDGMEWHKAVWHLQNRSLQFLPVALPPGAELVSARVGGQGVRADSGTVAGRAAILVPLIRTRPGDISYDVELVWRRTGKKLENRDSRKFDDAELIGITVEQTFWNVWLPEEREVTNASGNMAEVIEAAREVEKGRAAVEELKGLNKLLKSEKLDLATWQNAQRNFDLNCAVVETQFTSNQKKLQVARPSISSATKPTKQQVEMQFTDLNEANIMESEELKKVVEENRRLQAYNNTRFAQQRDQAAQAGVAQQAIVNAQAANPALPNAGPANTAQLYAIPQQQLQLDGVVNNAYSGATNLNAGNLNISGNANADARWKINPAKGAAATTPAPAQKPGEGKSNYYLNDNIVLKEDKETTAAQPASKSRIVSADAGKKAGDVLDRAMPKVGDGELNLKGGKDVSDSKPSGPPPTPAPQANIPQQQRLRTTNVARGNRLQLEEEQKQQMLQQPMTPPASQPMPTQPAPNLQSLSMVDINAPAQGQGVSRSFMGSGQNVPVPQSATPAPNNPAGAGIGGGGFAMPNPQEPQSGLENAGRVSLSVDFPTEGHVYHFQKVKANAALDLSIADTTVQTPWSTIALCAGAAALLALISRMTNKPRLRRA